MKDATIHAIDSWLGRPICWLLTLIRRVMPEPSYTYPPRNVLCLKLVEQGATVLAYGAVERAIDLVGRENVYFLVFEENRPILDAVGWVPSENILCIRSGRFPTFVQDAIAAIRRCRRLKIDALLDMEHFARASAILAFLSGARIRVGLHRYTMEAPYRGDLLTHRLLYNPYLHTARYYDLLGRAMAFPPEAFPTIPIASDELSMRCPVFSPSEAHLKAWSERMAALAGEPEGGPVVILNPNAADRIPGRKWPLDRYVALAEQLLQWFPSATLIVTGTASERDGAEIIRTTLNSPRVVDLTGTTSLEDLLVLYCIADVLVTNDSGPAHFASMTPIDVVVLFGPETPLLYGPIGDRVHIVYKNLVGTPSVSALNHRVPPTDDNAAMRAIETDEVVDLVKRILTERLS